MSRASAGYADFFPTAPSVLQQKKQKATLERQRARKIKAAEARVVSGAEVVSVGLVSLESVHGGAQVNGGVTGGAKGDIHTSVLDDDEPVPGDLLNGVGSASSHTSTVSSIFSGANNLLAGSNPGILSNALATTPLTNVESSPPERDGTPPASKQMYVARRLDSQRAVSPSVGSVFDDAPLDVRPVEEPHSARIPARPLGRQVKGEICTYDPELDKKLSSKEKRKLKPVYREFGLEVRRSRKTSWS